MKPISFDHPEDSYELASLFRYASRLMARTHHARRGDFPLKGRHRGQHAQGKVLAIIRDRGPISQGELLELLDVRSSSLSELLGKLQDKGLIKRERNEADKRSFTITATKEADELLAAREITDRESSEHIFAALDPEERKNLHALLTKIIGSLQEPGDTNEAGPHSHGRGKCDKHAGSYHRKGGGRGPGGRNG